ncbi:putative ring finger protein [Ceratocystis lukuohia]|uniref:Ring finger protein n=1 Tax=Ceratocystis lukuohia TaxID=2019550 RepID=A0ABR4MK91_9PEZI
MDGERRTLRGRAVGLPLSVSTSAAAASVATDRNGRHSPLAFSERSAGTPRDHHLRPRLDSLHPPPSSVYSRRSTVPATPRPPSVAESRTGPAYSTYGGDRGYDRDDAHFVQSPRSVAPPHSSSFAQMERERDSARHSWDATQGPLPTRPRRMSMLQSQGDRPSDRPRRGSLLQNEVAHERPRRLSMYQPENISVSGDRHRRGSIMQGDFPPASDRPRRQSFMQQQYQNQQKTQQTKNDMVLASQDQAYSDRFGIPRPSSAAATNSSSGDLVLVKLIDLERDAGTVLIKVRPNATLFRVGEALTQCLHLSASDYMVHLYQGVEALRLHQRVNEDSTFYYRLVGPGRNSDSLSEGSPKVVFEGRAIRRILQRMGDPTQMLEERIRRGISVGDFRIVVSKILNLEDPDQVLVEARNGMRVGAIEGEDWRLIDISNFWLCSKFRIFIIQPGRMISIRLLRTTRRFLFHSSPEDDEELDESDDEEQFCSSVVLKSRFIDRIIVETHATQQSSIIVEPHNLHVYNVSKTLTPQVAWGSLVCVDIPSDVRAQFFAQEKWLLGETTMCDVCLEERHDHEFSPLTAECNHNITMCTLCANKWLDIEMGTHMPNSISCPSCKAVPTLSHLKRWARPDLWERFDMLLTTSALRNITNFYCRDCAEGQNNPMFRAHDDVPARFRRTEDDNNEVFDNDDDDDDDNDDFIQAHNQPIGGRNRRIRAHDTDNGRGYDPGLRLGERRRWNDETHFRNRERSVIARERIRERDWEPDGDGDRDIDSERAWVPRAHDSTIRHPPVTRGNRQPAPQIPHTPRVRTRRESLNLPRRPRLEDDF